MATGNAVYCNWLAALLEQTPINKSLDQPDAVNGPYAALVTIGSGYYNFSQTHQWYSPDLTNVQGTPQQITSPTITPLTAGGVGGATFSGSNVTFLAVTGTAVGAIVIYRPNSGANTTWRLCLYYDSVVTGLPVTPNGGNVLIQWSSSGIFTL